MSTATTTFIDRDRLYELADTPEPTPAEVDDILSRALDLKGISVADAAKLINIRNPESKRKLLDAAGRVKEIIYGKRLVLFAPLYTGNACTNNCLYCSFRKDNRELKRKTLTMDEVKEETRKLVDMGHKRVLLIGGESAATGADYFIDAMRAVYSVQSGKGSIRRINLEIAPLEENDFVRFKNEKLGTYICFQETYDPVRYAEVHPSGKKRDYEWRLNVMDRAMRAGIGDVGIGALFGLADHRFEVLALLEHAHHLDRTYGAGPHTVSVPRIEPADGAPLSFDVPYAVDDDAFRSIVAVIRLALPYTGIILSTRERGELRRELFRYGISQISGGSRTNPGGYSDDNAGAQFSLGDHRTLDEVISSLIDDGYIPSFCTGCYRKGRVGKDFMDLAKPGLIAQFCLPNGIFTFMEYLEDYAAPETKAKGTVLAKQLAEDIPNEKVRIKTAEIISRIASGERDFYL